MAAPDEDRETALLIVAMELLRTAVVDLRASLADTAMRFSGSSAGDSERDSRTSAFSRPQPVIIMGPVPLQVSGSGGGSKPPGPKPIVEKKGNVFADIGSLLAAKFSAVLGPLAIFGQILQSNTSGFQLIGTAVKVLAATLGPVLMPLFMSLAASLLNLQEELEKRIMPAMKQWTRFIFGTVLPVLAKLVEYLMKVIDGLAEFFRWLGMRETVDRVRKGIGDAASGRNPFVDRNDASAAKGNIAAAIADLKAGKTEKEIMDSAKAQGVRKEFAEQAVIAARNAEFIRRSRAEGHDDNTIARHMYRSGSDKERVTSYFDAANAERDRIAKEKAAAGGGGAATPAATPESIAAAARARARAEDEARRATPAGKLSGLDDLIKSLRLSVGPKASYTGFGEVQKQAQLAALNADPIEMRMYRLMMREVEILEEVASEMRGVRRDAAAPPLFPGR